MDRFKNFFNLRGTPATAGPPPPKQSVQKTISMPLHKLPKEVDYNGRTSDEKPSGTVGRNQTMPSPNNPMNFTTINGHTKNGSAAKQTTSELPSHISISYPSGTLPPSQTNPKQDPNHYVSASQPSYASNGKLYPSLGMGESGDFSYDEVIGEFGNIDKLRSEFSEERPRRSKTAQPNGHNSSKQGDPSEHFLTDTLERKTRNLFLQTQNTAEQAPEIFGNGNSKAETPSSFVSKNGLRTPVDFSASPYRPPQNETKKSVVSTAQKTTPVGDAHSTEHISAHSNQRTRSDPYQAQEGLLTQPFQNHPQPNRLSVDPYHKPEGLLSNKSSPYHKPEGLFSKNSDPYHKPEELSLKRSDPYHKPEDLSLLRSSDPVSRRPERLSPTHLHSSNNRDSLGSGSSGKQQKAEPLQHKPSKSDDFSHFLPKTPYQKPEDIEAWDISHRGEDLSATSLNSQGSQFDTQSVEELAKTFQRAENNAKELSQTATNQEEILSSRRSSGDSSKEEAKNNHDPHLSNSEVGQTLQAEIRKCEQESFGVTKNDKMIAVEELEFGKMLGAGHYGMVYAATWRGGPVALKKIQVRLEDQNQINKFYDEVALHKSLRPHPNVLQFIGVVKPENQPFWIISEYCSGGSLLENLDTLGDQEVVSKLIGWLTGISAGLLHLHCEGVIHRDLAARNILLTGDERIKIADFGMSRVLQEGKTQQETSYGGGPLKWMSPESLSSRVYSVHTDVWSFAVVIWEILGRCEPYKNYQSWEVASKVSNGSLNLVPDIKKITDDKMIIELVTSCMSFEPKHRPDFQILLRWFSRHKQHFESPQFAENFFKKRLK